MRNITDKQIDDVIKTTSQDVLDIVYADESSFLIWKLAPSYGVPLGKEGLVAEEVQLVLLKVCTEEESPVRISERTGISTEKASLLLQAILKGIAEEVVPKVRMPVPEVTEIDGWEEMELSQHPPRNPAELLRGLEQENTSQTTTDQTPSSVTDVQTLGAVPEANKELKEKLVLRPEQRPVENIAMTADAPTTKPLTREEVLQSFMAKRTMQSDISSIQKRSSEPLRGYEPMPEESDDEK